MRTEYKIYSIHYACVSMCLCIHVFVWVLGGVGECLGVYEKFCYKNFGRPWRGRGGGFWETFGQPRTDGGGGGSENHDFGRTSFVNAPLYY